jgi:repressor LexA
MENNKKRVGRPTTEGPTPAQLRIVDAIREFVETHGGIPPKISDIAQILGIRAPSVHELVDVMIQKGLLSLAPGTVRRVALAEDSSQFPDLVAVPVFGVVAAGAPIFAAENRMGEIWVETSVVRGSCFALQVKGDSMVDADIQEGDFVIVRRQPIAENGEIVVALLGDEATVKRLYISGSLIELRPANPAYRPIRVRQEDELRILGKVLAVRNTSLFGDDS